MKNLNQNIKQVNQKKVLRNLNNEKRKLFLKKFNQ